MLRQFTVFIVLLWAAWSSAALAYESSPVDTGKVMASLVSSHDAVAPGSTFRVALRTELDDHWHTYWRNPGDSGEPVFVEWSAPDGIEFGDMGWPLPAPIPTGPIINYGFEGAPLFVFDVTVPDTAVSGRVIKLKADFYYLVCKDICIPEKGASQLLIKIGEPEVDSRWSNEIDAALAASPKAVDWRAHVQVQSDQLNLQVQDLPDADFSTAYFFPDNQGILGHSNPQAVTLGSDGLQISTTSDYGWDKTPPTEISGVLAYDDKGARTGVEITAKVAPALAIGVPSRPTVPSGTTLLPAIIGAFIGGLILNLMPCVFPVISLKALSLAKTAHGEREPARRAAWAYTIGVLATFLLLAALLIGLKVTGSQIGWGFQLQSPWLVGLLALLLFVIGMNLLGFFEFGGALQNTGQGLTTKEGFSGSFFTGALAVVVAAPCLGPFMAGAMGYALAQPPAVTLIVFIALALGFAAPFLLLGYAPGLLARLPKPGPWMVRFKEILAFPMLGAAIWLVWVVSVQTGSDGMLKILVAMLAAGLAIWLWARQAKWVKGLAILAIIASIALPLTLKTVSATDVDTADMQYEAWSPEAVARLRAEGRPVFVDFTAAWCVTCKVNEMTVLKRPRTQKLFEDTNTAFLIADWTNKDSIIAEELERYGRAGVPLYLLFSSDQKVVNATILPQVLTYDVIKKAIADVQ